ncbi:transcriptional repressor LexA [Sediminicoccus sp. KRV36]|uniref:transcriptional repressor LexA n=1 Tax=Sediminicoccus sp. KRV36 TaxID=3133721 RepID=UPI00200F56A2|nr:transcriptional repressor LexA [Sediminicoccus rosea]UPY36866.1 transcriptional repressor LexA [Sediminicoccus rosea]
MLTRKQLELLMFIQSHQQATGFSPSFDEMKVALSLKSKSGIHRLISGLEERGFIKRRAHRARALEIVRSPLQYSDILNNSGNKKEYNSSYVQLVGGIPREAEISATMIPLLGRIAAGLPIEAISDHEMLTEIPSDMLIGKDCYALEVSGESMRDAGILDGDTVVIRRGDSADNGDIVVALIDKTEVTLKKFRKKGNSIALEPANKMFETRIFGPDRVEIQGKLVGLLRKY